MLLYGGRTGVLCSGREEFCYFSIIQRPRLHRCQSFCGKDMAGNSHIAVPKAIIVCPGIKTNIPYVKGLEDIVFDRCRHNGIIVGIEIGAIAQNHAVVKDCRGNGGSGNQFLPVLKCVAVTVHDQGYPGGSEHAVRSGDGVVV